MRAWSCRAVTLQRQTNREFTSASRPAAGGQFGPASTDVFRTWVEDGRVAADSWVLLSIAGLETQYCRIAWCCEEFAGLEKLRELIREGEESGEGERRYPRRRRGVGTLLPRVG